MWACACVSVCVRVCFLSLSDWKTKVTAKRIASRAMSINHDVVTVNLVPGKTSSNILLAKPLCLNSGGLPQLLQWFLSMEVGSTFDKWGKLWQCKQNIPKMNLTECDGLVTKSCLTLFDPMDCSSPGFSVHGIFQARILEWVAISFSRGSSQPRDQTAWVYLHCRWILSDPASSSPSLTTRLTLIALI